MLPAIVSLDGRCPGWPMNPGSGARERASQMWPHGSRLEPPRHHFPPQPCPTWATLAFLLVLLLLLSHSLVSNSL